MKREQLWDQLFKKAFTSEESPREQLNRTIINETRKKKLFQTFKAKCESSPVNGELQLSIQEELKDLKKKAVGGDGALIPNGLSESNQD